MKPIAYPLIACVALLLCVFISNPTANSGFNDDWSYAHVALKFAENGHFQYNGWGSPSIVFQSVWAALWIRLCGFSFDLLRLVTLPFSIGFVWLTYALGRKAGLHSNFAFLAALIIATSPLYIPLAASFMTEAYCCFFLMLCLYAAISCAQVEGAAATKWLWVLTVSGVLGGSDRQVGWIAPMILIPYLIWSKRHQRRFIVQAIAAYLFCGLSLLVVIRFFSPRYGPLELSKRQLLSLAFHNGDGAVHLMTSVLLSGMLMALPALVCVQPLWKKIRMKHILILVLICAVAMDYLVAALGSQGVVPFSGNIVTSFGLVGSLIDGLGYHPLLIPRLLSYEITAFLLFCMAAWVYFVRRHEFIKQFPSVIISVFFLFTCAYIVLLFPGAMLWLNYDRYVLPILPLVVITILIPIQPLTQQIPITAYGCVAVLAAYGVVTTHDYFATLRTRNMAVREVLQQGISKGHVSAGLEHDGWAQLELTGKMNPTRFGDNVRFDLPDKFWFWFYATAIKPDYVAICSRLDALPQRKLLYVPFTTWTFPFQRAISVVKKEDLPH